jgi:hypothetical protein
VGEEHKKKPLNQVFLGVVGILLLVAAVVGSLKGLPDAVAIAMLLLGGSLVALAAFWSRIQGTVELSKDGLKFPVGAVDRGEKQLEQSKVVDAESIGQRVEALEWLLRAETWPPIFGGTVLPSAPAGPQTRNVQLVDDAVATMLTLTDRERTQVEAEIARISQLDFQVGADPRAIRPGDHGRSYHVHKVPDTTIRLWYRQSDTDPEALVVMVIEKKD